MDYSDRQQVYDLIKQTTNSDLWSLSAVIATKIERADKQKDELQKLKTKIKELTKQKEEGLNSTSSTITDSQLRARLKVLLLNKLEEESLTAAEIGQLKDIFNLASSSDDLTIESINYKHALLNCPECNANLLEPPAPTIDSSDA